MFTHLQGQLLALLARDAEVRAELEAEHGPIVSFGMGDSRSDARFMAACDYAIIPNGTQLAALTVAAL